MEMNPHQIRLIAEAAVELGALTALIQTGAEQIADHIEVDVSANKHSIHLKI
jgi:hypothetical protein